LERKYSLSIALTSTHLRHPFTSLLPVAADPPSGIKLPSADSAIDFHTERPEKGNILPYNTGSLQEYPIIFSDISEEYCSFLYAISAKISPPMATNKPMQSKLRDLFYL
jgi:hypothetical protein